MSILLVFNKTIRMFNHGIHPTKARLLALQYLSKQGSVIQSLCDYFKREYPQWLHLIEGCSPHRACNIIVKKLDYHGEEAWNGYCQIPSFGIRTCNAARGHKVSVERHPKTCRIHEERHAYNGYCNSCHTRIKRLKKYGYSTILNNKDLLRECLSMPFLQGRGTFTKGCERILQRVAE